jgi:predicted transcriptional regulator
MSKGDGGTTTPGEALEPTEIHDVLRNERRRLVLEQLLDTDTEESVRDLAEYIASIEAGESPPPRNVRQSVYVSLHQTHLPKLDELGIVAYDSDTKAVSLNGRAGEVAVYLDVDESNEGENESETDGGRTRAVDRPWPLFYGGVGLIGALALLGNYLGVPGAAAVDGSLLGSTLLAAVFVIASYQYVAGDGTASGAESDV